VRINLRVFDDHEQQFSAFRTERMNALKASDKEREKVLSSKSFDLETKGAFRLVKS
jgi:predicted DNA-binding transcriptional regulator YafY